MIPYTYTVVEASQSGAVIEYTSPGRRTMRVGTHAPRVEESLESLAAMYAPIADWIWEEATRYVPEVGSGGSFTPPAPEPMTLERAKRIKLDALAEWRYQREVQGIVVGGAPIRTDRESQATITSALISLREGLTSAIEWKTASGVFVSLGLAQMQAIAQAVVAHVQSCFSAEAQIAPIIEQAETIEAVEAVVFPDVVGT